MMIDPRVSVIDKRLSNVNRIIAFSSAKGGVGKSMCASVGALVLADSGYKVGILDLDFQGASDHLILGGELHFPEEAEGILPLELERGIKYMGFSVFSNDGPVSLRGDNITDAFLEILSVTIWRELDYLIIDMPPGMGEEVLDLIKFVKSVEFLLVSTGSVVSVNVVERFLRFLKEMNVNILGIIENMVGVGDSGLVEELSKRYGVNFLGAIKFDTELEKAVGKASALLSTRFAGEIKSLLFSVLANKVYS